MIVKFIPTDSLGLTKMRDLYLPFIYVGVAVLSAVLAVQAFNIFQGRRQGWKSFDTFYRSAPIEFKHSLISPSSLRVEDWQIGDSSSYRLKNPRSEKTISYYVPGNRAMIRYPSGWQSAMRLRFTALPSLIFVCSMRKTSDTDMKRIPLI